MKTFQFLHSKELFGTCKKSVSFDGWSVDCYSLSEYLTGDIDHYSHIGKTKVSFSL